MILLHALDSHPARPHIMCGFCETARKRRGATGGPLIPLCWKML